MKAQTPSVRLATCVVLLFSLALAGSAQADAFSWAGASSADSGFRVGANGRLQPGLVFTGAYQSNVYRTEADPEHDFTLQLRPHLRYLLKSDDANFKIYGEYLLKKYLGAFVDHAADPVGHKDLDIYVNYMLGLSLMTRPKGQISFIVADDLQRLSREFDNQDRVFHRYSLMDRLTNNLRVGLEGRPGSSLQIRGMFHFDLGRYTGANTQGVGAAANRIVYGQAFDLYGSIQASWRFFPKTQLLLMADFGHIIWDPTFADLVNQDNADPALASLSQYDSDHWRVWFGVQGKFSRQIALQGMVGYGNAYFPEAPDAPNGNLKGADGILGKVQLHWTPVMTQRITVGFLRDYRYLYFSNYYVTTNPYVRYEGQIAGFILPEAGFAYHFRKIAGDIDRQDHEIRANLGVEFQITDFFTIGPRYGLWAIVASDAGDDITFTDHEIGIRVEFGY